MCIERVEIKVCTEGGIQKCKCVERVIHRSVCVERDVDEQCGGNGCSLGRTSFLLRTALHWPRSVST